MEKRARLHFCYYISKCLCIQGLKVGLCPCLGLFRMMFGTIICWYDGSVVRGDLRNVICFANRDRGRYHEEMAACETLQTRALPLDWSSTMTIWRRSTYSPVLYAKRWSILSSKEGLTSPKDDLFFSIGPAVLVVHLACSGTAHISNHNLFSFSFLFISFHFFSSITHTIIHPQTYTWSSPCFFNSHLCVVESFVTKVTEPFHLENISIIHTFLLGSKRAYYNQYSTEHLGMTCLEALAI